MPSGICAHVDKQESVGVSWASTPNRRKGQSGPMRVHVQSWVTLPKGICQPWSSHGLEGNLKNLFKDTSKPRALLWFGKVNREGLCLPTFTGNSVSDIRPLGPGNVMIVFLSLSPTPQFLTALILLYRLSIQPFIQKLYWMSISHIVLEMCYEIVKTQAVSLSSGASHLVPCWELLELKCFLKKQLNKKKKWNSRRPQEE